MSQPLDIHPAWCHCASCEPYVPADRFAGRAAPNRLATAAMLAVATAIAVAALIGALA